MHLVWKKKGNRDFAVESDGEEVGRLKIHGATGATAQFGTASWSFRVAGLDPAVVAPWKRRFSHDCSIVDLGSGSTVASFVVGTFGKTLRLERGAEYRWKVSFLMRSARWASRRTTAVEFRLRGFHSTGDIVVAENLADAPLLVMFGMYLAKSGK